MIDNQENPERGVRVKELIKSHMMWCVGGGLIPVPILDMFIVGAIQMNMIKKICKEYEVDYAEQDTKALISTMTTQGLSKIGARSMAKLIPGLGSIVGGITLGILSGASTYALGEVFKKHFEEGGTVLDFDPSIVKKYYNEKFEKGKKLAEEIRKNERSKFKAEKVEETDFLVETTSDNEEIEVKELPKKHTKSMDIIEKLTELGKLKENGLLSEKEFKKLKKELLG